MWALFPPALLLYLCFSVAKPAVQGRVPGGPSYVFWLIAIFFWSNIFELPFGHITAIHAELQNIQFCKLALSIDLSVSIISLILIILTFRERKQLNSYVPLNNFHLEKRLWILGLLSLSPLLSIVFPDIFYNKPDEPIHPLLLAFSNSLKNSSYSGAVLGFLAIGLLGPIFEEVFFRGLLLAPIHEEHRSTSARFILDFSVCLFFGLIHLPISFTIPFIFSAVVIYARRRTNSLLPCFFMHAVWNTCVLIVIAVSISYSSAYSAAN